MAASKIVNKNDINYKKKTNMDILFNVKCVKMVQITISRYRIEALNKTHVMVEKSKHKWGCEKPHTCPKRSPLKLQQSTGSLLVTAEVSGSGLCPE